MDPLINSITNRRSVREFNGDPVERHKLLLCAEAGRIAPSACNSQPWKFVIVDDPAKKSALARVAFAGAYGMNSFAARAGAFIVIVSEPLKMAASIGQLFRGTDFRLMDTGIACAHITLQATELGIDSCILGWFDEKKTKKILHIPPTRNVPLMIALGYGVTGPRGERSLKPREDTMSLNTYK
ncbi:MAG: nitroreductase family protein [Candidatus Omnitrophica bacterium]|nr:nitroreductase family protein [Candidatus Omnitrophota bacterium]